MFKQASPPPPKSKYISKAAKALMEPMPFAVKSINAFFRKSDSENQQFMLAQKEGQVQYSAEVIDDVNDELNGRLVLAETSSPDTDYRYVPFESGIQAVV